MLHAQNPPGQTRLAGAFVIILLFASVAIAGNGPPASEPAPITDAVAPSADSSSAVVPPAGVLVFIDPETGRILERPTAEQHRALFRVRTEQALRAADERDRLIDSLRPFPVPGGEGLDVTGVFLSSVRVHRGADGKLHFSCDDQHDATPALSQPEEGSPPPAQNQ